VAIRATIKMGKVNLSFISFLFSVSWGQGFRNFRMSRSSCRLSKARSRM
jgi:hypothetical protein